MAHISALDALSDPAVCDAVGGLHAAVKLLADVMESTRPRHAALVAAIRLHTNTSGTDPLPGVAVPVDRTAQLPTTPVCGSPAVYSSASVHFKYWT
jgi:hypothetical protein